MVRTEFAKAVVAISFVGSLMLTPTRYKPMVLGAWVGVLAFTWLRTRGVWRRFAIAWLIRIGRAARRSEPIFRTNLLVETLWIIAAGAFLVSLGTHGVSQKFAHAGGSFAVYTFALGGAVHWASVGFRLGQIAWVRAPGKIAVGVTAAVVVCISRSSANDFVASAVHADPKHFPIFLDLATTLMSPCLGIAVAAVVTMALTLPLLLLAILLQMDQVRWLLAKFSKLPGIRSRRLRYFTALPTPLWASAFSGFAAAGLVFALPMDSLRANRDLFTDYVTQALVHADFRPRAACEQIAAGARVAFVEHDLVVVAQRTDGGRWSFSRQACRTGESHTPLAGTCPNTQCSP